MKKTILVVLMLVMVTTPCLAEIEPDGIFSIEGTKWLAIPIGIFPPILHVGLPTQYLGFYNGKVYHLEYGEGPYDIQFFDDSSYVDLLGIGYYLYNHIVRRLFGPSSYYKVSGIMYTPGIGIALQVGEHSGYGLSLWTLSTVILLKVTDNWEPWINTQELDFGVTETNMTFRLRVSEGRSWRIESSKSWVTFSPDSGNEGVHDIVVTVDRSKLYSGNYGAKLNVFSEDELLVSPTVKMEVADFPDDGDWQIETVDSIAIHDYGPAITSISIALDSNDKAYISYIDTTYEDSKLKYATNTSDDWVTEALDSVTQTSVACMVLDSNDKVHISYNNPSGTIKYLTNTSGEWVTETVDIVEWVDEGTISMALDSSGKVHISYTGCCLDEGGFSIKYATNTSNSWVTEKLDFYEYIGGGTTSLTLDSDDNVHISYIVPSNLVYAINASGSWTKEKLPYDQFGGGNISLVLDSENKAHIGYIDYEYFDLKYTTNASGSWIVETVDDYSLENTRISTALDSHEHTHISYISGEIVHVATNASGKWVNETLEAGVRQVRAWESSTSLALDSANNVHISYAHYDGDSGTDKLKYAQHK